MTEYLTLAKAREVASIPETLADKIGVPYEDWAHRCHEISFELLKTGLFGKGRIARGWAEGVTGQHSWIVLGPDVYSPAAVIVDPTVFFYLKDKGREGTLKGILVAKASALSHTPHGKGSIWGYGRPADPEGEIIRLAPGFELSDLAEHFLSKDVLGPLDWRGWSQLANGVMQEWPAGEIIAAMDDTERLRSLVPIDILGMVTPRNPLGRYLAGDVSWLDQKRLERPDEDRLS